ncbi:MAG: hypothetical protein CMP48_19165 [Rickettsiales bacterium]|nr:hypothetical protein [Rickettsiales bacterium]
MSPLEAYFDEKPEPLKGTLAALKQIIMSSDSRIEIAFKYRTAFFCIANKNVCYLSINTKGQLYIGFILGYKLQHSSLAVEGRKQIKVYYVDPNEDINLEELQEILHEVVALY